jgi:hypothetical protein
VLALEPVVVTYREEKEPNTFRRAGYDGVYEVKSARLTPEGLELVLGDLIEYTA